MRNQDNDSETKKYLLFIGLHKNLTIKIHNSFQVLLVKEPKKLNKTYNLPDHGNQAGP